MLLELDLKMLLYFFQKIIRYIVKTMFELLYILQTDPFFPNCAIIRFFRWLCHRMRQEVNCVKYYVTVTGFVWALEILENPGKCFKPWKSLETPGKAQEFFFISPGKSHRTLLKKKFAKWCILLIPLQVTIEIVDFHIISNLHFVLETTA